MASAASSTMGEAPAAAIAANAAGLEGKLAAAGIKSSPADITAKLPFTDQPLAIVATCNLNQWALDFDGNKRRIIESIKIAKQKGARYRVGPELEITGYSCEDHFYEMDMITFSWMALCDIINATDSSNAPLTQDIICDIGMPILHNGVRYNCRVFVLNGKILLIRPKMWMADDGNYREDRHFTPWDKSKEGTLEEFQIPKEFNQALYNNMFGEQRTVPFGIGIIQCVDATIGSEICEELFTAESTNILLGFEGCDIMSNGSASHFQLDKRQRRHDLIKEATTKNGGVYLYANQSGCDGNRLLFDGNGMIYMNGKLQALGDNCTFQEVEVLTATLNLNEVRSFRASNVSHQLQADKRKVKLNRIKVDFELTKNLGAPAVTEFDEASVPALTRWEEMGISTARYLFDYLIRSVTKGFFLPLSGGVDSSSTAMLVYFMCDYILNLLRDATDTTGATNNCKYLNIKDSSDRKRLEQFLLNKLANGTNLNGILSDIPLSAGKNFNVQKDATGFSLSHIPTTRQLMNLVLHTCNMPTKNNSGKIMSYALTLAKALGSYHITVQLSDAFDAIKSLVAEKNITLGNGFPGNSGVPETVAGVNAVTEEPGPFIQDLSTPIEIPRYTLTGGDFNENLAIQNVQARLRMITAYYLAQIIPIHRGTQFKTLTEIPDGKAKGLWDTFKDERQAALAAWDSSEENKALLQKIFKSKNMSEEQAAEAVAKMRPEEKDYRKFYPKTNKDAQGKTLFESLITGYMKSDKDAEGYAAKQYAKKVSAARALLVLASSNSDEALRGFYTKYDAASADINPIGSYSKHDLRQFLLWCVTQKFTTAPTDAIKYDNGESLPPYETVSIPVGNFQVLYRILVVVASPELVPEDIDSLKEGKESIQDDEVAIKLTYEELYYFGIMRKVQNLGPLSMFLEMCKKLLGKSITIIDEFNTEEQKKIEGATPISLYKKLVIYWGEYARQRNKMTILTPAIHATNYSPDDNRFDQRPFLVSSWLTYQFNIIRALAYRMTTDPLYQAKILAGKEEGFTKELERINEREESISATISTSPLFEEDAKREIIEAIKARNDAARGVIARSPDASEAIRRRARSSVAANGGGAGGAPSARGAASASAAVLGRGNGGVAQLEPAFSGPSASTASEGAAAAAGLGNKGGARRNLTHLRRVTRDKKREAKRKAQTRKN